MCGCREFREATWGHISTQGAPNVQCSLSTVGAHHSHSQELHLPHFYPSLLLFSPPTGALWSHLWFFAAFYLFSCQILQDHPSHTCSTKPGRRTKYSLLMLVADSEALSPACSIFSLNIAVDIKCWNSGNVSGGLQTGNGFAHMLHIA